MDIHENLNDSMPSNEYLDDLVPFLDEGKKTIIFSLKVNIDENIFIVDSIAQYFNNQIFTSFPKDLDPAQYKSDIDPDIFGGFVSDNLYLFLEPMDYHQIDSLIGSMAIKSAMAQNKTELHKAQNMGMNKMVIEDPLHFLPLAYKNLSRGLDLEDLIINDGFYFSKDKEKLMLHTSILFDLSDIEKLKEFSGELSAFKEDWNIKNPEAELDYFGTFLITEANASQIKWDIILTINCALLFIIALLYFYYRSVVTLLFFMLPGVFGICMALSAVWLLQGGISALALSASAVILGIVVDYSFHYFSHLSQEKDAYETRDQIFTPLIISSLTTIIAFLSLLFAQSEALQDFGLFTGLSLLFTLLFILVFLPGLIEGLRNKKGRFKSERLDRLISKFDEKEQKKKPFFIVLFSIVSVLLIYYSFNVQFEDDLNSLNYYPQDLKQKEIAHQNIDPDIEKRIAVISIGKDINEALNSNYSLYKLVNSDILKSKISECNSIAPLVFSERITSLKAKRWNEFWKGRTSHFRSEFAKAVEENGFSMPAFKGFLENITESVEVNSSIEFIRSFKSINKLILQRENVNIISSLRVDKQYLDEVKSVLDLEPNVLVIDGATIGQSLVENIKNDFNLLLILASITVFITMLLFYGRIEITLISFLPMVLSWIWILGIASLFDIKFNFINIMIATIIFGLGDDFAIFITDGLQNRLKYKSSVLATHKAGILLSSISTIVGTGVLIFAMHPAIKSIAPISVVGIIAIVVLSFVFQPFLFRTLILNRTEKGKPPYTLVELFLSAFAFSFFFIGSLITTLVTLIIVGIPFWKRDSKKLLVHYLIKWTTSCLVDFMFMVKKNYYDMHNLDFKNPSVIIANHTSFLDILILTKLHPKIVILVGPWVYNSVIFGWFIRFADFIPAFNSIETSLPSINTLVKKGYSVLVFPEAHRSNDGKLKRFHKGAFYLSEKLELDITPVLLNGLSYSLPKGEYYVKSSLLNLKVLPRIAWDDPTFGDGYSTKGKAIAKYFKSELEGFNEECGTPAQYYHALLRSYIYKGPKLEWYFRVKFKFEKDNFQLIDNLIGERQKIYDLGCGYGFLSYFLKLRSSKRNVYGFDYDDEKIAIAQNSYLKTDGIEFKSKDITKLTIESADAIILSDVLHYLKSEQQLAVLNECRNVLTNNGVLIIKDALKENAERHAWTEKSEKWSTQLVNFNKTNNDLHFFDYKFLSRWAEQNNLNIRIEKKLEKSSNAVILISK